MHIKWKIIKKFKTISMMKQKKLPTLKQRKFKSTEGKRKQKLKILKSREKVGELEEGATAAQYMGGWEDTAVVVRVEGQRNDFDDL